MIGWPKAIRSLACPVASRIARQATPRAWAEQFSRASSSASIAIRKPGALLAEAMRGRHACVGESDRGLRRAAKPGEALVADHFEARRSLPTRNAVIPVAGARVGLREHREDVRDAPVRAPGLGSIQKIGVAVALRGGLERRDIRTRTRLRQREGGNQLAGRDLRQQSLLQRVVPVAAQRRQAVRPGGEQHAETRTGAAHPLDEEEACYAGSRPHRRTPRAPRARTDPAPRRRRGGRVDRRPTRRWPLPAVEAFLDETIDGAKNLRLESAVGAFMHRVDHSRKVGALRSRRLPCIDAACEPIPGIGVFPSARSRVLLILSVTDRGRERMMRR